MTHEWEDEDWAHHILRALSHTVYVEHAGGAWWEWSVMDDNGDEFGSGEACGLEAAKTAALEALREVEPSKG